MQESHVKLTKLKEILSRMESVLIAYSGGVDSSFLVKVAKDVLNGKVLAVTACSETYTRTEQEEAGLLSKEIDVRHKFIVTEELKNPDFSSNPQDRCYYCKSELFGKLKEMAQKEGIKWVADGTNSDDTKDHRPGRKAASNCGVRSPLLEAGLTKPEIRGLSKEMGLPTWDKPALACLASRLPYGEKITADKLNRVEEAEKFMHGLGFKLVRVRSHGNIARIELSPEELEKAARPDFRRNIITHFKKTGFVYVTLDLEGYRTGSMNEGIT